MPNKPHSGSTYEVTPLELFFDLAFVFAVSQLSHHLLEHLTWKGMVETTAMLLAVLSVWSYTSWAATLSHAGNRRTRQMVLMVMIVGLFMNASIPEAFKESPWLFSVPLVLIQVGRTIWTILDSQEGQHREHFRHVLIWFFATTPLWLLGSVVEPNQRLLLWVCAVLLDLIGTVTGHPVPGKKISTESMEFDAEHMVERCRLFLIIALGETVLTTGVALSQAGTSAASLVAGLVAITGTITLWFLLFGFSNRLVSAHIERTNNPVRASHFAMVATFLSVGGLIAVAVANEIVISHPQGHSTPPLGILLALGPMLVLGSQAWYLASVLEQRSRLHMVGLILVVATAATAMWFIPVVVLALSASALALTVWLIERQTLLDAHPGKF